MNDSRERASHTGVVETSYDGVREALRKYDVVIGIEVHCQLATATKIFSSSAVAFGGSPNTHVDPTCVGLPGALPVLNEACVDLALRMGIATECHIPRVSVFERKNYFYPDLPKGFQITQFAQPVCRDGHVALASGKVVRIQRIQLEEDAGKNLHVGSASLCDYNRAGVGLIEVVSHPDMGTPEEASEYVRRLHQLAVSLGVSDGDLERGNFRADANVSLKPKGSPNLGQRTETKNVNSFRFLERAIAREVERQFEILESGGRVVLETRGYDSEADRGFSQRSKEEAHDYRYFPEPDLPPVIVTEQRIARVRGELPELPEARAARYVAVHGLSERDAASIASLRSAWMWFDAAMAHPILSGKVDGKTVAHFLQAEVLRLARVRADAAGRSLDELDEIGGLPVAVDAGTHILALVGEGTLSLRMARDVVDEVVATGASPADVVRAKGLVQVSDEGAIAALIERVLADNPKSVADYLAGKEKLMAFFVGQAMKLGQGKLNPAKVNEALAQALQLLRG
jgi:aspartyl-tRNA(Asn)/glutamyl-tRNA(Gln) amidotransferase subunit B